SGKSGVYNLTTCLATKTCTGGDFDNPTPTGCTPPDCTSASQTYKCNCLEGKDPIGCICPTEPQQLVGIRTDACPCNGDDDPRRGTACEVTRICSINDLVQTPCLCSQQFNSGNCTCTQNYHDDQQCICDLSGKSGVFELEQCQSTKICTDDNFPIGCTCPPISQTPISGCFQTRLCNQINREELSLINISICSCYGFGDPRSECSQTQDCDIASISELNDVSISACPCFQVGDPRIQCSQSKSCNEPSADLNNIPISLCPCNGNDDPRRGITCEVTRVCSINDLVQTPCLCSEALDSGNCTCTEDYHSDQQCICDQSGKPNVYELEECRSTKICIGNNIPIGCTCLPISQTPIEGCETKTTLCKQLNQDQLRQTDISICSCYGFGDPRSECSKTQDCDIASQSDLNDVSISACPCFQVGDPRIECSQSKSCNDPSANLINIPEIRCACNDDDDPRRGTICEVTRSGKSNVYQLEQCQSTKMCVYNNIPIGCTAICQTDSDSI
ncbi:MAG: hypothetical protein EZS28_041169, partial [Streblomastix strix]